MSNAKFKLGDKVLYNNKEGIIFQTHFEFSSDEGIVYKYFVKFDKSTITWMEENELEYVNKELVNKRTRNPIGRRII